MKASIRGRIDLALPATVTSFELIGDRTPFMITAVMTLEIRGPFVGKQGDQSLWDEIEPEALASLLKGFEGQDLLAVESDPGWLHLDFTNGWIRVVAATTYRSWESWEMTLPKITWKGGMDGNGPDKDWKVDER